MKMKEAFLESYWGARTEYFPGYKACIGENPNLEEFYITYSKGDMPPYCTDYFKSLEEAINSFEQDFPDAEWHPIFDNQ